MNLYLLQQSVNNDYDTYDSCVVCAENEEEAKKISPGEKCSYNSITGIYDLPWWKGEQSRYTTWCHRLEDVEVTYIGVAADSCKAGEVICASFNAG